MKSNRKIKGGPRESQKIAQFFHQYEGLSWYSKCLESLADNNFCDLLITSGDFDNISLYLGSPSPLSDAIKLGREAQTKPIYQYYSKAFEEIYYFIGTEEEILQRLQSKVDSWLKANPQRSLEEIRRETLERTLLETQRSQKVLAKQERELKKKLAASQTASEP